MYAPWACYIYTGTIQPQNPQFGLGQVIDIALRSFTSDIIGHSHFQLAIIILSGQIAEYFPSNSPNVHLNGV
jgi:hypothetical protein